MGEAGLICNTLPRPPFARGEETAEPWGELEFRLSAVVTGDGLEGVRTAFHGETRVLAGFVVVGGNISSLLLRASGVTEWNQESGTRPSTVSCSPPQSRHLDLIPFSPTPEYLA